MRRECLEKSRHRPRPIAEGAYAQAMQQARWPHLDVHEREAQSDERLERGSGPGWDALLYLWGVAHPEADQVHSVARFSPRASTGVEIDCSHSGQADGAIMEGRLGLAATRPEVRQFRAFQIVRSLKRLLHRPVLQRAQCANGETE
jgi:hypothetical protein